MKFSFTESISRYLATKDYWLLYLLVRNPWFRWASVFCCLVVILTIASVLNVWQSTPEGVTPRIRISFVDWIQSQSFSRAARHYVGTGDRANAVIRWRMAIGHDPGSRLLNRSYLRTLIQLDHNRDHWSDGFRTANWLLKISPSDRSDLELATQALEHYRMDAPIVRIIDSRTDASSPKLRACMIRALFRQGANQRFDEIWKQASPTIQNEPTIRLFRAAHDLVHGEPSTHVEAKHLLEQAGLSEGQRTLVARLNLHVRYHTKNLEGYGEALDILESEFASAPIDHTRYWKLLHASGREELARQRALRHNLRPQTHAQVMELADGYAHVGLPELAIRLFENQRPIFGFHARDWLTQTDLLFEQGRWNELWKAAITIRRTATVTEAYVAYSYFLQGLADHHREREKDAKESFDKIPHHSLEKSDIGLYIGSNLSRLGYQALALEVTSPNRSVKKV
jgi:tetratricopeptide (TPR) repeat protein